MNVKEIRALSAEEIRSRLDEARETYFKFRFQYSTGQLTDTSRLKYQRQLIARLATILREQELAVAREGGEA
jgi:large subunit ribosomal protein L29